MAKRSAEVEVKVTGAEEAAEKAKKVKDAWSEAAEKPGEKWKKFGDTVASSVEGFISDVSKAINIANGLGFVKSIESARQMQQTIGRTTAYTGQSIKELTDKFERLSRTKLIREEQGLAMAKALTRVTYDARGAQDALFGLADEAVATGRSADEMLPLGATLHNVLGVSGATSEALKSIRGQAEAVGTVGGVAVLEDALVSLSGTLAGVSSNGNAARASITGLLATMQGGSKDPQHGARAFSGYAGAIQSQALLVSRFLGRKTSELYDNEGKIKPEVFGDVQKKWFKTYGKGERSFEQAVNTFGPEGAAEFFHKDFSKTPTQTPAKTSAQVASDYYTSDAGQREKTRQDAERNARESAAGALPALDTFNSVAAKHPYLASIGTAVVGALASKAAGAVIRGGVKALFRGGVGAAAEGAVGGGAASGGAGALGSITGGALGAIGFPIAALLGINSVISAQQEQTQQSISDYNAENDVDPEAAARFGTEYARQHRANLKHGGMEIVNDTPYGPETDPGQHVPSTPQDNLAAFIQSVDGFAKIIQQGQQQPIVIQVVNGTGGPVDAVVKQRGSAGRS